ncbi:hypothetical protein MAHJHV50_50050 [Mycobacterium avium subsp. hominissuis]
MPHRFNGLQVSTFATASCSSQPAGRANGERTERCANRSLAQIVQMCHVV